MKSILIIEDNMEIADSNATFSKLTELQASSKQTERRAWSEP